MYFLSYEQKYNLYLWVWIVIKQIYMKQLKL